MMQRNQIHMMTIFFPEEIVSKSQQCDQLSSLNKISASRPPRILTPTELQTFAETLPAKVQKALNDKLTSKKNPNLSFHGQPILCHVILCLVHHSKFYTDYD